MALRRKKEINCVKTTILIVGEGPTEKAFLQYLKELYISRDAPFSIKIESGCGGSPNSVIQKAIRLRGSRAYDKCFVLVDTDKPLTPDLKLQKRMHQKPRIEILGATPCIEGLFLAILQHPRFSPSKTASDSCKYEFEKNYIAPDKKPDKRSYADRFSRTILEERRKQIPELDAILKALQVS